MKGFFTYAIAIGICLLSIGLVLLFDKWLFETVVATDWPDWVKYLLLA